MAKGFQSFNPRLVITNHFDDIINKIDIKTETHLENQILTEEKRKELNEKREKQIEIIEKIKKINLNQSASKNDEYYEKNMSHIIDDDALSYQQKLNQIKENLIQFDCVLLEHSEADTDLLLTFSWFLNQTNLEFLKLLYKHKSMTKTKNQRNTKSDQMPSFIFNKINARSFGLINKMHISFDKDVKVWEISDFSSIREISLNLLDFPFKIIAFEKECFKDYSSLLTLEIKGFSLVKSLCDNQNDNNNSLELTKIGMYHNFSCLKKLNLSENHIDEIDLAAGFRGLENLEELNLSRNKLTKIKTNSFQNLNKLKKLNLAKNQIEQLFLHGFQGLDNLEELDLEDNKLKTIESNIFHHLSKLTKLKVSHNLINEIGINGFQGLENLEVLDLGDNRLIKIVSNSFQYLNSLKKLFLRQNQIENIDLRGFQGLDNLEELNLWINRLKKIESNPFRHLDKLKKLFLDRYEIIESIKIHSSKSSVNELKILYFY